MLGCRWRSAFVTFPESKKSKGFDMEEHEETVELAKEVLEEFERHHGTRQLVRCGL